MIAYIENQVVEKLLKLLDDYEFWYLDDAFNHSPRFLKSKDASWAIWEGMDGLELCRPVEMSFTWRNRRRIKRKWRQLLEYHFAVQANERLATVLELLGKRVKTTK